MPEPDQELVAQVVEHVRGVLGPGDRRELRLLAAEEREGPRLERAWSPPSGPARLTARLPAVIGSSCRSKVSRKRVWSRSRTVALVLPA